MAKRRKITQPEDVMAAIAGESLAPAAPTLQEISLEALADLFSGQAGDAEQVKIEPLRQLCRDGNPFPLIAVQWPELLVEDLDQVPYFEGTPGGNYRDPSAPDFNPDPCLRLDDWQRDIIRSFFDDQVAEIAIKGNTKAGKGTSVGISVNLWFDVWKQSKIILTSANYEHAVTTIFGEVRMWRRRMTTPGPGRLLGEGIGDTEDHYITIKNPLQGEAFSGQHGPRTLFVFDEASGTREMLYKNAQKQFRKIVALSNPRTLFGWFRELYDPAGENLNDTQTVDGPFGKRRLFTISGANCLNVRHKRLEKAQAPLGGITINGVEYAQNESIPRTEWHHVRPLIPNQCDYGRYMGICANPDKREVAIFAHGKFPDEDPEKQVILGSWIPRHAKAWEDLGQDNIPVTTYGLDVARSLIGDASVLSAGSIAGLREQCAEKFKDITEIVEWVLATAQSRHGVTLRAGRNPICVDMDGLGAGAGDLLRKAGVWVIEFRGNSSSLVDPKRYANLRTEAYAEFGARLNPEGPWSKFPFPIPSNRWLHEELCAPEKVYGGGDMTRFGLMPKRTPPGSDVQSVHGKIGRSPDLGDSAVYWYTATRVFYQIADYMASIQGALTVWPPPEFNPRQAYGSGSPFDPIEPGTIEQEVLRHPIRDWEEAAKRAESDRAAAPEQTDLLAWLQRYK